MIKINRPPLTSLPEFQEWAKLSESATHQLLAEFAAHGKAGFDQLKPEIWQRMRGAIAKIFHSKCAACESRFGVVNVVDVAHFRPKRGVVEDKSAWGYWWLAYDWNNLLPLCSRCDQMKGARFPIAGKRALSPSDKLSREEPFLLDPCVDDPSAHLAFDDNGAVVGRTEHGRITIEIYGLNPAQLVDWRKQAIEDYLFRVKVTLSRMLRHRDPTAREDLTVRDEVEYAAALRAALHRCVLAQQRAIEFSA